MGYDRTEQALFDVLDAFMAKPHDNNVVVDIGCSTNSHFLKYDCDGVIFDLDPDRIRRTPPHDKLKRVAIEVTPDNVVPTLKGLNIPKNFKVLNLDIDSYDLYVLIALLKEFTPEMMIVEINTVFPPDIYFSVKYERGVLAVPQPNMLFGFSIKCIVPVLERFGYYIHTLAYNNLILMKRESEKKDFLIYTDKVSYPIVKLYKEGYLDAPYRKDIFFFNMPCEHWQYITDATQLENEIHSYYDAYPDKYYIGGSCLDSINLALNS